MSTEPGTWVFNIMQWHNSGHIGGTVYIIIFMIRWSRQWGTDTIHLDEKEHEMEIW